MPPPLCWPSWRCWAAGFFGWMWLDPLMGIVGAVLVAVWAKGLIVETGKVLLDREMDHPVVDEIREVIESPPGQDVTRITDLHVWRVGQNVYSCALTVVTRDPALTPVMIRERLSVHEEIVHSTIEIHLVTDSPSVRIHLLPAQGVTQPGSRPPITSASTRV